MLVYMKQRIHVARKYVAIFFSSPMYYMDILDRFFCFKQLFMTKWGGGEKKKQHCAQLLYSKSTEKKKKKLFQ